MVECTPSMARQVTPVSIKVCDLGLFMPRGSVFDRSSAKSQRSVMHFQRFKHEGLQELPERMARDPLDHFRGEHHAKVRVRALRTGGKKERKSARFLQTSRYAARRWIRPRSSGNHANPTYV